MAKVYKYGKMGQCMKVIGKKIKLMVKADYLEMMVIYILEIGMKIKLPDMEHIFKQMDLHMKVTGLMKNNMEKV